jgi:oligoendopeptidase F
MKTEWDLTLLYKNLKDPSFEKDIKHIEKVCETFSRKYKNIDFSHSLNMSKILSDFEVLQQATANVQPIRFLRFMIDIGRDEKGDIQAKLNQVQSRIKKARNKIKFFTLALGAIPKQHQKALLSDPSLKPYRHFLSQEFKTAQYNLSEEVEKVLSLINSVGYDAWTTGQSKLLSSQTITFNGTTTPIAGFANILLKETNKKTRQEMQIKLTDSLKAISPFAEAELNAIYSYKKITDDLRGFKHPSDDMLLENADARKAVDTLITTVSDHFSIVHKYYEILAKELGLLTLGYEDRQASIGSIQKSFLFEDSVQILKEAFRPLGEIYVELVDSFVKKGQIDVYPRKGKRGGAFCAGAYESETFVLLNHVNDFYSLQTFAHEMGHAFHTHFSKERSVLDFNYSLTTAETASTFFENIVFEHVLKQLNPAEQKIALFDRAQRDVSTIFRQIACYKLEADLHEKVRDQGYVSKEEIARIHNKNMSAYLGPKVSLRDDDGYLFVSWPHLRYYFYVYTYAYGLLTSRVLVKKVQEDPTYMRKVEMFLKAGGSDTPVNIFKKIGVDTTKPNFFKEGLLEIKKEIEHLKSL